MEILSLGHSSFLLDTGGVRILGDPWLDDWCIGDLMGRFPRLRFDPADLEPIDAIYLSHSHTDHIDPYTLRRLWSGLSTRPTLLLPVSLRFLELLLTEYLPDAEIVWLEDRRRVDFRGVEIEAFFDPGSRGTNEDDVMLLVVDDGREVFLNEADALLPLYEPEVRELVAGYFADRENAVFLTTRNELAATMGSLSAVDAEDRRARIDAALEGMSDQIAAILSPTDEGRDPLWGNRRLLRLVAGQGLAFPTVIDPDWNHVLFPIRRADRVQLERQIGDAFGTRHRVEEFLPGEVHRVEEGILEERETADFLTLLEAEPDRWFDRSLDLFSPFPVAPLRDDRRPSARGLILTALNDRFRPWLIGLGEPPIERLLTDGAGEYRVRVRYGTTAEFEDVDYGIGFETMEFQVVPPAGEPDEHYWANDIEDVLDGRADEFSVFLRKPLGGTNQRFWHCLGLPFLNQDLVEAKLRLHFERAAAGETAESWVRPFYGDGGRRLTQNSCETNESTQKSPN
ncbi:MAG: MBL fold metallo-hydrolase [Planctomycetota bacterium]